MKEANLDKNELIDEVLQQIQMLALEPKFDPRTSVMTHASQLSQVSQMSRQLS